MDSGIISCLDVTMIILREVVKGDHETYHHVRYKNARSVCRSWREIGESLSYDDSSDRVPQSMDSISSLLITGYNIMNSRLFYYA
jgi:hypothetical protein